MSARQAPSFFSISDFSGGESLLRSLWKARLNMVYVEGSKGPGQRSCRDGGQSGTGLRWALLKGHLAACDSLKQDRGCSHGSFGNRRHVTAPQGRVSPG